VNLFTKEYIKLVKFQIKNNDLHDFMILFDDPTNYIILRLCIKSDSTHEYYAR